LLIIKTKGDVVLRMDEQHETKHGRGLNELLEGERIIKVELSTTLLDR